MKKSDLTRTPPTLWDTKEPTRIMPKLDQTDGYARVSTLKQVTQGHGLSRYIEDLEEYGISPDRIFWDVESGASPTRKGYNDVLERVRQGITNRVVVPCFDRFTRDPVAWEQVMEEFQKLGAELHFVTGGSLDLITPEGRKQARDQASTAAYWREKNQYAAKKGWERRRRKFKAANPPFGYLVIDDKYVVNREPYKPFPEKTIEEIALEVVSVYSSIGTIRGAVHQLCLKYGHKHNGGKNEDFPRDRKAFKIWLENPTLRGHLSYFGSRGKSREIAAYDNHEALIKPNAAQAIDRLLKMRERNISSSSAVKYPLTGFVFCDCGWKSIILGSRKRRYYCADLYDAVGTRQCINRGGLLPSDAEEYAITAICEVASIEIARRMQEAVKPKETPDPPELIVLRTKLEQIKNDPDLAVAIPGLQQKIADIEHSLRSANDEQMISIEALQEVARDPDFFYSLDVLERRYIYSQTIDRLIQVAGRVDRVELLGGLGIVRFDDSD